MSRFRTLILMLLILMLPGLMAACLSGNAPPLVATGVPAGGTQGGGSPLPAPQSAAQSPLPDPTRIAPVAVPTSKPGTGTVVVRLLRLNGAPLKGGVVYAGPIVAESQLASVDPVLDRSGETDDQGNLAITNLAPGQYALVIQSPVGLLLLEDAAGKSIIGTVEADKVTQLGEKSIEYEYPDY